MEPAQIALLVLAVGLALAFEFVNGFHDTANAVATVIYTRSLRARWAVLYSALLNFLGVLSAGVGVAYSIVHLFPMDSMLSGPGLQASGAALIFAVLGGAILWNLGTWYVGIPASSSHALIGSILGASMGYCIQQGLPLQTGVPWDKARQIVAALLISPLVGMGGAALLLYLTKKVLPHPQLHQEPPAQSKPPLWIRALLIGTCGSVSFAHGSNDGQKGMGLLMLILIGLAPAAYSLNSEASPAQRLQVVRSCREASALVPDQPALAGSLEATARGLETPLERLSTGQRLELRRQSLEQIRALKALAPRHPQAAQLSAAADSLQNYFESVALWVKLAVALALGLGTTVGYRRIVVTVGEKIGKTHLTYAQGGAAETMAAATILLADRFHMPVSTTHVLSSGIAGTMLAQGSGVQARTLRNIGLAWVLTLPVCISLSFALFVALSGAGPG